jgi:hypothetical protein
MKPMAQTSPELFDNIVAIVTYEDAGSRGENAKQSSPSTPAPPALPVVQQGKLLMNCVRGDAVSESNIPRPYYSFCPARPVHFGTSIMLTEIF